MWRVAVLLNGFDPDASGLSFEDKEQSRGSVVWVASVR